jgi:SWI/SNF-related matrix-associated actin-dependent regulator of chromatin subfamily A member 5
LLKDINLLARSDDDAPSSATVPKTQALSNLIMQLRKCCVHPFLFDGAEVGIDSTTCEDLIAASGKLTVLDMLLRSLYEKKHRVVLFSQLPSVLDILDDYCTMRGWKHGRFDGSAPRAQRNFIVNQFNAPDSDYFVFLMSTRSGSMRLNLQTADTCILFDSDWNLQPDIQAAARKFRRSFIYAD